MSRLPLIGAETPVYLATLPEGSKEPRAKMVADKEVLPFHPGKDLFVQVYRKSYEHQPQVAELYIREIPALSEALGSHLDQWLAADEK